MRRKFVKFVTALLQSLADFEFTFTKQTETLSLRYADIVVSAPVVF